MKIKKYGYTLIELLLVIITIGILGAIFRNSFKPKNKDILYGEACVNNIYSDISSFINNAITSKNILSGNQRVSPEKYYIDINPDNNTINFEYKKDNNIYEYKKLNLTGDMPPNYYCETNIYTMIMSGNHTIIEINKGLKENSNLSSFIINNRNSLHENIFLKLCPYKNNIIQYTECKEIGIYEINTSIQNIRKSTCLNTDSTGDCKERTK